MDLAEIRKIAIQAVFSDDHCDNPEKMSMQAQVIDSMQGRRFRVDISKFEYCDGKQEFELDGYTISVYSLEMCAIEKLRAICQQMPEYKYVPKGRPRARDFYDIYAIISRRGIDLALPENLDLCRCIFAAKHVPLSFLPQIQLYREFHSLDWAAVQSTIKGEISDFDFYFDFVNAEVAKLQSLWVE